MTPALVLGLLLVVGVVGILAGVIYAMWLVFQPAEQECEHEFAPWVITSWVHDDGVLVARYARHCMHCLHRENRCYMSRDYAD